MKKYNLSAIMFKAWDLFRKGGISFSEALHRAWLSAKGRIINAGIIAAAKQAAGIEDEIHTYADWKALGYKVVRGMKAVLQVDLLHGSKGDGAKYRASFFAAAQVEREAV